jgi:hypothetical protein
VELNELIEGHERLVKAQRMGWLGQVERMSEERMAKRTLRARLFCRRKTKYKMAGERGDGL